MLKNALILLATFLFSINVATNVNAREPVNVTFEMAAQIALDSLGAGTIVNNRTGLYHGTPVHQILVEHNGENFRIFVDFQGEIVRGLVSVGIPQAEQIAIAQLGGGEVVSNRLSFFDGIQVYRIEVNHNGSVWRVLIDTENGEVLRTQRVGR